MTTKPNALLYDYEADAGERLQALLDAANGARRPVIIMRTEQYCETMQITHIHDIEN